MSSSLSVIMIARDESSMLPTTLPPLLEVAEEVVFVDTGSTDDTLERAENMGCRCFNFTWCDDFSAAKNYALQQATQPWILSVDCDEALLLNPECKTFFSQLPQILSEPAFLITIENIAKGRDPVMQPALRLFRRDARIFFSNPVHENIADSLYRAWPDYPIQTVPVVLRHHGYQKGDNRDKFMRNLRILRLWVERAPDSIYGNYKLGANLQHLGAVGESIFFLGRAFDLMEKSTDKGSYPFLENLITSYYTVLVQGQRLDEAEAVKQRVGQWR
ncbi:glycosyltransferase family 2 protein [Magnetococcales bacterium HHB-1]